MSKSLFARLVSIKVTFANEHGVYVCERIQLNLICTHLIQKENTNYRKYHVTSFSLVKDKLEDKIEQL